MDGVLAIDVGNSRVKAATFSAGVAHEVVSWRHEETPRWPADVPAAVVLGSVVPDIASRLLEQCPREWPATVVAFPQNFEIGMDIERPETVGVDRIANAVAAKSRFGGECIVVDAGTATTVDLISGGVFRGGAILPGVQLMADSLTKRTALLPRLITHEHPEPPLPGRDTSAAIAGGVVHGHAGAVAEVVGQLKDAAGNDVRTIVCGGAAGLLRLPDAAPVETLTLEGLATLAP